MDFKILLSLIGTSVSVVSNALPSFTIYSRRKTEEIHQIPTYYLKINHFCSLTWLLYSISIFDIGLIISNSLSSILSFISIFSYAFYLSKVWEFYSEYLTGLLVIGSICLSMFTFGSLGLICMFFNITTSLANLESIQQILTTKNHICIDFHMTLANFISGTIWMMYGIMILNVNIIISNAILLLVSVTLIVFYIYFRVFYTKEAYSKV